MKLMNRLRPGSVLHFYRFFVENGGILRTLRLTLCLAVKTLNSADKADDITAVDKV
jgi:hypothetical protein